VPRSVTPMRVDQHVAVDGDQARSPYASSRIRLHCA
jgi:hypothetical protein